MQHLIITCDDCGLSEGINVASAALHEAGIATTASVMTNFPAAQHAFDLFARYPTLELGVHLNLTDGLPLTRPVSPSAITQRDARFRRKGALHLRALFPTGRFRSLVEAELRQQIEVFFSAGLQPKHLTTHQHFHVLPALRDLVLDLAREYDVPWVRAHNLGAGVVPHNPFYRPQSSNPAYEDIAMPDYLVGIKWWVGRSPQRLAGLLAALEGAVELVIHPCTPSDSSYPQEVAYPPYERHAEVRFLEQVYPLLSAASA